MKGVVFQGDGRLKVVDIPRPEPGPRQVLIEIKASGLCGSDFRVYKKPASQMTPHDLATVRGHEPCGVVAEVGSHARNVKVGDRVVIHHYEGCGVCKHCLSGWTQLCQNHQVIYGFDKAGGHQDFMVCPDVSCVPMPDELSFEEGAACACGTGTSYQALKRLGVSGLDTLAIFGQGPVGASATLLGKAMGARVVAVDVCAERLELARKLGADEIIDASRTDPVGAIQELTGGEGADATMDCTGVESARIATLESARIWGRAAFVGALGKATFEMNPQIIHRQLTIHGSWTFSSLILAELGKYIVSRKVPLKDLITHRFHLHEAEEAYRLFAAGDTGKVVLVR